MGYSKFPAMHTHAKSEMKWLYGMMFLVMGFLATCTTAASKLTQTAASTPFGVLSESLGLLVNPLSDEEGIPGRKMNAPEKADGFDPIEFKWLLYKERNPSSSIKKSGCDVCRSAQDPKILYRNVRMSDGKIHKLCVECKNAADKTQEEFTKGMELDEMRRFKIHRFGRMIAEFEEMDGVMFGYTWELGVPVELVKDISEHGNVYMVCDKLCKEDMMTELSEGGVNLENVYVIYHDTESYHTRDYAPWFIKKNGEICMTDFQFYSSAAEANKLNKKLAEEWKIPRIESDLNLEGGNMMVDGNGRGAATNKVYEKNSDKHKSEVDLEHLHIFGSEMTVFEDYSGNTIKHIDCWAKYLPGNKVLLPAGKEFDEQEMTFKKQKYEVFRIHTKSDTKIKVGSKVRINTDVDASDEPNQWWNSNFRMEKRTVLSIDEKENVCYVTASFANLSEGIEGEVSRNGETVKVTITEIENRTGFQGRITVTSELGDKEQYPTRKAAKEALKNLRLCLSTEKLSFYTEPYINSLIFNDRVYVPVQDNEKLNNLVKEKYKEAMPDKTIVLVQAKEKYPWYSGDALHCRTREIPKGVVPKPWKEKHRLSKEIEKMSMNEDLKKNEDVPLEVDESSYEFDEFLM